MKIEYLMELLVLEETGNYLTASETLHVSQSTLSRHIMSVENYFGTEIVNRSSKRFTITEKGKYILRYAAEIKELYEDLFKKGTKSSQHEATQKRILSGEDTVI